MRDRLDNSVEKIFILFHFIINLEINIFYFIFAISYLKSILDLFYCILQIFFDLLIIVFHKIIL